SDYASDVSPDAPIVSITSPDDRTVVIKLKEPNATVLALLAQNSPGTFLIVAKEAQDQAALDVRNKVAGTGPWYLSDFKPGVGFYFRKNPGFKQDKRDLPYMDGVDWPVLREYAAGLAQFRSGSIYSFNVRAEEVLATKRDVPDLTLIATPVSNNTFR